MHFGPRSVLFDYPDWIKLEAGLTDRRSNVDIYAVYYPTGPAIYGYAGVHAVRLKSWTEGES